jgi:hypothetical protein
MTACENIRTRTLASDSIEKSENESTKANDEPSPYKSVLAGGLRGDRRKKGRVRSKEAGDGQKQRGRRRPELDIDLHLAEEGT